MLCLLQLLPDIHQPLAADAEASWFSNPDLAFFETFVPYSDRMVAEISDDSDDEEDEDGITEVPVNGSPTPPQSPRKPVIHGIQLASCQHYFCGVCNSRLT